MEARENSGMKGNQIDALAYTSQRIKVFFKNMKAFKKNALVFWVKRQGVLRQMP